MFSQTCMTIVLFLFPCDAEIDEEIKNYIGCPWLGFASVPHRLRRRGVMVYIVNAYIEHLLCFCFLRKIRGKKLLFPLVSGLKYYFFSRCFLISMLYTYALCYYVYARMMAVYKRKLNSVQHSLEFCHFYAA